MGKLGVREKSLIHQTPLQKTTPIAIPGFGTGFVPFGAEPDEPEQGVPGGTYNFGQSTIVNPSAGTLWQYRAKTTATSGYPGDGYILWDNATQTSAANLIFAHITDDNLDIDLLLATAASGNTLIIQDANDSLNFQKWTVSGSPTNTNPGTSTSYWTIPVTLVSSGGTGTTGFPNNHQIIVFRPGTGGGSTTTNVTNNYIVTTDPVDDPEQSASPVKNFGGVTNSALANMAAHTVKANITGSAAAPVDSSLSAILDAELSSTQGVILYRDASAWAALATGTSGQALVTQGAAANPHWASVGAGSGGAMTYINTATVTGSANSNITISSLSLATDQSYYGQFVLLDATGATPVMNLFFNGDTTAANYWRQNTFAQNAALSTTRSNNANIIQFSANKQICGEFWILKDFNGAAKARIMCMGGDYSATTMVDSMLNWITVTDVTSITINSSGANGFAVGSYLKLWSIHS